VSSRRQKGWQHVTKLGANLCAGPNRRPIFHLGRKSPTWEVTKGRQRRRVSAAVDLELISRGDGKQRSDNNAGGHLECTPPVMKFSLAHYRRAPRPTKRKPTIESEWGNCVGRAQGACESKANLIQISSRRTVYLCTRSVHSVHLLYVLDLNSKLTVTILV